MAGKGIRELLMGGALALVIVTGLAFGLWAARERDATIAAAGASMLHSGRLLAAMLDAELAGVDKVLAGAAETYAVRQFPERDTKVLETLTRLGALSRAVRGVVITGADGRSRYATNLADPFQPLDLSDRTYVRIHARGDTASPTFLSEPLISRNDGKAIVVLSRRLTTPDGGYGGVIAATISVTVLEQLAARSFTAPATALGVVNANDITLIRLPDLERHVGKSLAGRPLVARSKETAEGAEWVVSPFDGRERRITYSHSELFGLTVYVTAEKDVVVADWQRRMLVLGVLAGLACMVICWLAWHLVHHVDQLGHARAVADRANAAKTAFLANMSHELRTPLNAIMGFSDALMHGITGEVCRPRCHEYLGHVLSSGQHLLGVINEVLDLSKVEEGQVLLNMGDVDLALAAREAVVLVAGAAEAKGIHLSGPPEGTVVRVLGDAQRLRQVVINLVANAVKFTGRGGRVEVTVIRANHGEVELMVADNGIGMTPDELAVALTPFGQVASEMTTHEPGTGLGLPLSKRLVELSGGRLTVESHKGSGTRVTVRQPGLKH